MDEDHALFSFPIVQENEHHDHEEEPHCDVRRIDERLRILAETAVIRGLHHLQLPDDFDRGLQEASMQRRRDAGTLVNTDKIRARKTKKNHHHNNKGKSLFRVTFAHSRSPSEQTERKKKHSFQYEQ